MTVRTDADLFRRGTETLVASWEEYSRGAVGAFVQRLSGVAIAVFPNEPERAVYNNALLVRDLPIAERADAVAATGFIRGGRRPALRRLGTRE